MRHPKLALLAALAASMVLVPTTAAQAAMHLPDYQTYTGFTYPGTPAGLDECNAEGSFYAQYYGYDDWICKLNQPDAGLYGLYVILKPPIS